MIRKLFRSGPDIALTLPSDLVDRLNLVEGAEVDIRLDDQGQEIIISPAVLVEDEITPEFARIVEEFIEEYRPALAALSRR